MNQNLHDAQRIYLGAFKIFSASGAHKRDQTHEKSSLGSFFPFKRACMDCNYFRHSYIADGPIEIVERLAKQVYEERK
jgi:hypothetical protein